MKKWSFFFTGIAVLAGCLYFAIQKNLIVINNEPAASTVRSLEVSQSIPVPEVKTPEPIVEQAVVSQAKVMPAAEKKTVAEVAKLVQKKKPAVKEPTFVERVFCIMEIYRDGNQKFIKEDVSESQPVFERAFDLASELPATNLAEKKLKNQLMEATWARLGSIRFASKIVAKPEDQFADAWWHHNIDLLKKANESIIDVVRMTGEMIQQQTEAVADDKDSGLLIDDLQRNAKGVLAVSKSPHS